MELEIENGKIKQTQTSISYNEIMKMNIYREKLLSKEIYMWNRKGSTQRGHLKQEMNQLGTTIAIKSIVYHSLR